MIVSVDNSARPTLTGPGLSAHEYASLLRHALVRSYRLLRERDPERVYELVLNDTVELLGATVARLHQLGPDGRPLETRSSAGVGLPRPAAEMEAALLPRALERGKSLLSSHPLIEAELADLARRCGREGITTHVLLLRAHQRTYAAVGVHWIGIERPDYEARSAFHAYWDSAGLAVATAHERAQAEAELEQLRRTAFRDGMTGLANAYALERELHGHADTFPLSVLVLDFDGLREANNSFGWKEGGDVLIEAVGTALGVLAADDEFPARMHTAGDEFALLLPGREAEAAAQRAAEIEARLDGLEVPERLHAIYRGASVGHATRLAGETPGQTLGPASTEVRRRKAERRETPSPRAD
jgi:diguanylate cyclase (GGDEF)-like protein